MRPNVGKWSPLIGREVPSVKSEYAFFLEGFSELEDAFFHFCGGLVFRFFRSGFLVVKVNAIQSLALGQRDPSLDGGFCFVKIFRDFPEGTPRPASGDHLPTFVRNVAAGFYLSC